MKDASSFPGCCRILVLGLFSLLASCQPAKPAVVPTPSLTANPVKESTSALNATDSPPLSPVRADPSGLLVDGSPFRFIGANAIYFGFYKEYGFGIDEAIRSAKENGIRVIRMYLGFGDGTWSGRPIEEYDKTLDIAARNGMYVIAVLTDCCCMGGDWSSTESSYFAQVPYCDFTNPAGWDGYQKYLNRILLRKNSVNGKIYRDDTTILAWDVANEPYLKKYSPSELNGWLSQVTRYIKSIDPNHLLTFGLDATPGEYDADGPAYDSLNVPDLDLFSFHYNLPNFFSVPPHLERIKFRVEKFLSMGKPVVLEEFGVGTMRAWGSYLDEEMVERWLRAYKIQMDMTFSAGGSGAMFWGWGVPETRSVPLWWKNEDHDVTETAFCEMLRDYRFPAPGSFRLEDLPVETPNDDFDGKYIDWSKWLPSARGGGMVNQKDGRMVLFVDDDQPTSYAMVTSTWELTGDFDIQIDFEISEGWGAPAVDHLDGAAFGVTVGGRTYHITRLRSGTEDVYFGWSNEGPILGKTPTSATVGKYRLVRAGSYLAMFYDLGNEWREFATTDVSTAPAQVYFLNGSVNASRAFTTYFDNFRVNSGISNYRP